MRTQHPSDVTDRHWQVLAKLLAPGSRRGRPPLDRRWVLNAILEVLWTGRQWRRWPHDFPPWKSVDPVFWRRRNAGIWKQIHDVLRARRRRGAGQRRLSRGAILDSQSVGTAAGGENSAATMRARRSPAACGTWRWTRWGWRGWRWCRGPNCRTTGGRRS